MVSSETGSVRDRVMWSGVQRVAVQVAGRRVIRGLDWNCWGSDRG